MLFFVRAITFFVPLRGQHFFEQVHLFRHLDGVHELVFVVVGLANVQEIDLFLDEGVGEQLGCIWAQGDVHREQKLDDRSELLGVVFGDAVEYA